MSGTIRAVIADDEPLARERLRTLLAQEPDVEVVAECGDGRAAIDAISTRQPELVFLDVQMPGIDGFGVLQALDERRLPVVIFVTAYDKYALQAFEVNALDYLLKPFNLRRFRHAVERAREEIARTTEERTISQRLLSLLEGFDEGRRFQRQLVVKSSGRIMFLRVSEIDWIEAEGNYIRLHVGATSHLLRETMKGIESRLDPERFVRIHRSTIVQADRIKELQPLFHGEYAVLLHDGTRLTASRGPENKLRKLLDAGVLKG